MTSIAKVRGSVPRKVRLLPWKGLRVIPRCAWGLVLLSALLQIASFPIAGPLPYWRSMLGWFALSPLLAAILSLDAKDDAVNGWSAAWLGYACGILWYAGNCYWIYQTMYLYGGLPKPIAAFILILFSMYLGLYHAGFAVLLVRLRRTTWGVGGAFLVAPFAWVAVELARARITGFPWDLLGNSQVDNLLVTRIAPLAGVMGISFLLAAVNASLASPFVSGLVSGRRPRLIAASAGLAVALCAIAAGGLMKASYLPSVNYAVLMQENLSVGATARGRQPVNAAEELQEFSAMSLHPGWMDGRFKLPAGVAPALVIWPEAPSHFRSDDPDLQQRLGELARAAGAAVIAGDIGVVFDQTAPKGYYEYDSASMFSRQGVASGRYDKIHLVPWGEYVPFKHVFAFAEKLTEGVGDMDPGHERTIFRTNGRTDGHAYGVFICYESIFGDEVREFVQHGAEALVNISDDGWYGDTGAPWQHLNMARMRAIENHRYLLRSTNTGITTVIDPLGRMGEQAPRHVRGAFALPFGYESDLTIYTRFGDWFAYGCVLVVTVGLGFSFAPRQTKIEA